MSLSAHVSEFALRDIIITGERDSWVAQMTPGQAREFAAELIERADYADMLRGQESEAMPRE